MDRDRNKGTEEDEVFANSRCVLSKCLIDLRER